LDILKSLQSYLSHIHQRIKLLS